jgi:hypothetical protein
MWAMFFKILFRLVLLGGLFVTAWLAQTLAYQSNVKGAILVGIAYWGFGFVTLVIIKLVPAYIASRDENRNWLVWGITSTIGVAVIAMLWPYWVLDPIDDSIDRAGRWFKQENEENSKPLF